MTGKWFATKGEIASLSLGAMSLLVAALTGWDSLASKKAELVSGSLMLAAGILFLLLVFRIRKAIRHRKLGMMALEHQEMVHGLIREYLDLMRRWPTSEAVLNPFLISWRPTTGETIYGKDVEAVMAWTEKVDESLGRLEHDGQRPRIIIELRAGRRFGPVDCIKSLLEVSEFFRIAAKRLA